MTRNHLIIVVALIVLLSAAPLIDVMSKGPVIGPNFAEDSLGVVKTPPSVILAAVNEALAAKGESAVSLDELALARAMRSEHGSEPQVVRQWVAHAIVNSARKGGRSVFTQLTRSNGIYSGLFARRRVDARYAATKMGATLADLKLAREVLSAKQDPTNGATNFFSPETQDELYAKALAGDPRYAGKIRRDAAAQRTLWAQNGLKSRGAPPGVSINTVEFFGA